MTKKLCWKAKFRLLSGWMVDRPRFRTRREAVAYALASANRHTVIVDFDVVQRHQAVNSCFCRV